METATFNHGTLRRRASLGVTALFAAIALFSASSLASVAEADSNEPFCTNVTLPPYGSYGDHCYAWTWEAKRYINVIINTQERAGCASYAAASGYDLQDSWVCFGKYTYGYRLVRNDGLLHRGVIRNNNLSFSGKFSGGQVCCFY
jgi:hypothetical protein